MLRFLQDIAATLKSRTFRSLQHRDFRLYFFGQVVSFVGSWMQSTALMWLVYDLTSDTFWTAAMLVASVGPTLLLGPISGSIADRLPKRKVVFVTQSAFLVNAIVLMGIVASGKATPLILLSLQLISGLIQALDLPARLSFVPDLIPKDDLINAVSLNAMAFNVARFLGPAMTGLIYLTLRLIMPDGKIAELGAAICFLINAGSFAAVLFALYKISAGRLGAGKHNVKSSTWDGFRFLNENRPLALLIFFTGLLCVFTWPILTLMPAFTVKVVMLQEKAFSFFLSALGLGAVFAALITATYGTVNKRRRMLGIGSLLASFGVFGLSQVSQPVYVALSCSILGMGLITFLSTGQSTMQLRAPDHLRGRVMAFWAMTLSASAPIGNLVVGKAAQFWPVQNVISVMAGGCFLSSACIILLCWSKGLKG